MAGTEQLNEVLVLRVTAEFQGFVRDLLDLATIKIVRGSGCGLPYQAQIIAAMSRNRVIDRGNPRLEAIEEDLCSPWPAESASTVGQNESQSCGRRCPTAEACGVEERPCARRSGQTPYLVPVRNKGHQAVHHALTCLPRQVRERAGQGPVGSSTSTWKLLHRPVEPMMSSDFNSGDRVSVPWGLDEVKGTVLSLFGPPGKQFARVEIELVGDDEPPTLEVVSLPVDLLIHRAA
jgi:hypothetical protein